MPFEYLEHQADLGIRGIGATPPEALSQGAQAMLAAMADTTTIAPTQSLTQHCHASDVAALFVEWLNELLYQREVHHLILAEAHVICLEQTADGWELQGIASGEHIDPTRHEIYTEVKAATFYGLAFYQQGDQYIVQCVVDL